MGVPYAEVIGDPIAHSKSPLIHKFWLEKLSMEGDYRATRVSAENLRQFLMERRWDPDWRGCNVTIPHKQAVLQHADEREPVVDRLGAANCIVRVGQVEPDLVADNTDWSGFIEPIRSWVATSAPHKFAYIVGAGGAAAAISYALDRAKFTTVTINRDVEKALRLRQRLGLFADDLVSSLDGWSRERPYEHNKFSDPSGRLDILVNATPLGMTGWPDLDINLERFFQHTLVYDIVYNPLETILLKQARERGMQTVDGLQMLVGQAAEAFRLFFRANAPREHDEELRELLTR